jgi:hypothetical protein
LFSSDDISQQLRDIEHSQSEESDYILEENVIQAEITNDVFDPARIINIESESNSLFLNAIRRDFSKELQEKAFSMFDTIIELRYGESLSESIYAKITSEIIGKCLTLFSEELSPQSLLLIEHIKRFSSRLNLQKEYLKSLGGLIEPQAIKIDDITYQYISIKKIANFVLNNQSLINQIIREQEQQFGSNNFESELACEFKRWQRINGKLRIQLYSDEFSIVNPIGHSRHVQNYLVIYCSFTNIPFKDRLKRSDLFLLLIVNHKEINSNILHTVLDSLNNELYQLVSTGIQKQFDNFSIINIPCVLSSFVGDSKSAYQFLGYPVNFGLYFRCRFCGANHSEIQQGILNKPLLGTDQDVQDYWQLVDQAVGIELPENDVRDNFGLIRKFKFASRFPPSVDPWGICPPDVCHDILEGTLPKLVSIILASLCTLFCRNKDQMVLMVTSKQFYDAPLCIKSVTGGFTIEGDMIQRAELLVRLEQIFLEDLPLMCGIPASQVQSSNPFQLFESLKNIAIISFQVSISKDNLAELRTNISKMFQYYKALDASGKVTPKMHHISHYPDLIENFGPLVHFSSLPFERKHQFFKQWARLIHNTKNPAYSLAVRHQCYQAVTFKANSYREIKFNFNIELSSNPPLQNTLPIDVTFYSDKTQCQLGKNVVRRIGRSNMWIEIKSFWKIKESTSIIAGGKIYEKSSNFVYTFAILHPKVEQMYIAMTELYHVNDFVSVLNGHNVLIKGII